MPTETIPLVGPPQQRSTGTGDQRFVNVQFERSVNEPLKEQTLWCVKRPGLLNHNQPTGGAAAGRGIYGWDATAKLYTVFSNNIYSSVTAISTVTVLATTSGRVWITQLPASSGARQLIFSDTDANFNVTTGDVVTRVNTSTDAQYPTSNTGPIEFLDGRLFQGLSNGQLWQSDNNSATSWTADNYISVDTHGGPLIAHKLIVDQIAAFTANRVEFYFNNGNPSGSVLLRIDQNTIMSGIASKNSLAWSGQTVCYVSENSADGDGGRSVVMLSGGKVLDIGYPSLSRFLSIESDAIATCSAWMERIAGHLCYVLNLDLAERTFVYDLSVNEWTEFEAAAGSAKFPGVAASSLGGNLFVQDAANGRAYVMSPTTYQDSGSNFTVTVQTGRRVLNGGKPFRVLNAELIADTQSSSTTSLLLCGDDNTTFNTIGSFDNTVTRKRITAGGYFESHVIARLTHAANTAWRAQALMLDWEPAS